MLDHWVDWAGQAVAAFLWLLSVVTHGRYEARDVLQLCASLSWLTAMLGRLGLLLGPYGASPDLVTTTEPLAPLASAARGPSTSARRSVSFRL